MPISYSSTMTNRSILPVSVRRRKDGAPAPKSIIARRTLISDGYGLLRKPDDFIFCFRRGNFDRVAYSGLYESSAAPMTLPMPVIKQGSILYVSAKPAHVRNYPRCLQADKSRFTVRNPRVAATFTGPPADGYSFSRQLAKIRIAGDSVSRSKSRKSTLRFHDCRSDEMTCHLSITEGRNATGTFYPPRAHSSVSRGCSHMLPPSKRASELCAHPRGREGPWQSNLFRHRPANIAAGRIAKMFMRVTASSTFINDAMTAT